MPSPVTTVAAASEPGHGGAKMRPAAWVGAKRTAQGCIVAYCTSDMSRMDILGHIGQFVLKAVSPVTLQPHRWTWLPPPLLAEEQHVWIIQVLTGYL